MCIKNMMKITQKIKQIVRVHTEYTEKNIESLGSMLKIVYWPPSTIDSCSFLIHVQCHPLPHACTCMNELAAKKKKKNSHTWDYFCIRPHTRDRLRHQMVNPGNIWSLKRKVWKMCTPRLAGQKLLEVGGWCWVKSVTERVLHQKLLCDCFGH